MSHPPAADTDLCLSAVFSYLVYALDRQEFGLGQMISDGLKQAFRLRQTTRPGGLASLHPLIWRHHQPAVILQQLQIPMGRSLAPHGRIHTWSENTRNGLGRDTGCRERDHIFSDPVGQAANSVHACGGNQEQLESSRHPDVLGIGWIGTFPRIAKHRSAREGLKGCFSNEFLGTGCHQHVYQRSALRQLADHLAHLVCGNAPGDANTDVPPLEEAIG